MIGRTWALFVFAGSVVQTLPQGITSAIRPPAPPPLGCSIDFPSTFGLAVMTSSAGRATSDSPSVAAVATGSPEEQPGPDSSRAMPSPVVTPVAQISDGQVQYQTTLQPLAQIPDGQVQHKTKINPITQVFDGQIQATHSPATVQSTLASAQLASPIGDEQPQAPLHPPMGTPVTSMPCTTLVIANTSSGTTDVLARAAVPPHRLHVSSNERSLPAFACRSKSVLALTLNNGVLTDGEGRTGYIASNYQFQFDEPAQSGAIYTAGFAICPEESAIALGDTTTFYQCLSGEFYNIYDRDFGAGQCSPITLQAVELRDC